MPELNDVLANRRFWASLYASGFGQITAEPPEPDAYCSLLGVSEQRAIEWNKKFTGWHPGIFGESDGYSGDPATVRLNLAGSVRLRIEFRSALGAARIARRGSDRDRRSDAAEGMDRSVERPSLQVATYAGGLALQCALEHAQ